MNAAHADQHDPAFPAMTMDILSNVLSRADNPSELGHYLTGEIRELTGARCAILTECLDSQAAVRHRVIAVNPSRSAEWADSAAMHRFYEAVSEPPTRIWRAGNGTEAALFLRDQGFDVSVAIPLNIGALRVGTMLVLGLVDDGHLDSEIRLLNTLSTIVALVMRSAFLYEKQEQTIRERTQQLQTSNDELDHIFSLTLDMLCVASLDGRFLKLNPAWERTIGYRPEELAGRPFMDLVHPDDIAPTSQAVAELAAGKDVVDFVNRYRHRDGSYHWIEWRSTPYQDGLVYAVARDITERRQVEESLRASNERTKSILSSISDAFFSMDDQLVVTYFNDAAERVLKRRREDVIGRPLLEAFPEARGSIFDIQYTRAVREKQFVSFETYFDVEPYQNWYGVRVYPQADGISVYFQVITARKESEDALQRELAERRRVEDAERQARARAEEASRAKDQFIAVLSHELRTPLTPVLAQVEMLRSRADLPAEVIASLEMIQRNVELESSLIADLLDITKVIRGELRLEQVPADAHEILRDALSICQPQIAAKGHQVEVDLRAARHMLLADPVRLRQIFWNLLGNAVKYTNNGGRIRVRSRDTANGRFEVQVTDNGVGIAPEVIDRLFEPFVQGEQTLSRRFGGLGLGLSIAKALVEAHHGTLRASSPGRDLGATFTAEFPVSAFAAPKPSVSAPATSASFRPVRILLVEDNVDTLGIMVQVLRLSRHEVRTATTVSAAVRLAAEWDFDLLICDIGLPDGTGWDLMRQLSGQNRCVRGLALSGFATEDDIQKSRDAGFIGHLAKPIKVEQLRHAIAMAVS